MNSREIELGWNIRLLPYRCLECEYMFATVGLYQTSSEETSSPMIRSTKGHWGVVPSQVIDYCPACGAELGDDDQVLGRKEEDNDTEK